MDARLLDEAADWLVRLNDEGLTAAERVAFERWRQASPAHEGAWMRAERLMDKLGGLPPALAMPALADHSVAADGPLWPGWLFCWPPCLVAG